jgi:hypothetical protein
MNPQEFIEIYGKSVYAIRLEVAIRLLGEWSAQESLQQADELITLLLLPSKEDILELF